MKEYNTAGKILERYRKEDKCGIRAQARKLGIGAPYLCDISHGNRGMTVNVLKKIVTVYKYKCVGEDFLTLARACYDEELIRRYKVRNHITDDTQAIRDLIYVMTGENL